MNQLSITTPPLAVLIQKRGYELEAVLEVMQRLYSEALVDGFEFQNLAEWDIKGPPLDKAMFEFRTKSWKNCEKHSIDDIATILTSSKLPILSVHANRDIGICLCSLKPSENKRGKKLIHDSLSLAQRVNARVCVFHLWDTWKRNFEPDVLRDTLEEIASQYPSVKAAVENIPTNLGEHTPFDIITNFDWITLDLRWAAMYNELDKFERVKNRIANVHLRGRLEGDQWAIHQAPFAFSEALNLIKNEWDYSGLLTVEPEGGLKNSLWVNFAKALSALKKALH